jgi:glycosyltransferase involved in cell wall biosynthesis
MTDRPLVSICIPVYNGCDFIGQAIESALAQTYENIEVVVLDNASTDDTLAVVSGFDDVRLRVERNEITTGAGENWNRALNAAGAEFVKLLSADDYLYPTCVAQQIEGFLVGGERVALVCSPRDIVDSTGRRLMTRGLRRAGLMPGAKARREVVRSGTNPIGETASALMRARVARDVGGFDESDPYTIDIDLWLRMLSVGDLWVVAQPLSAYRVSGGSWSVAVAHTQAEQYRAMLDSLHSAPNSDVGDLDVLLGRALATVNRLGRRIVYAMQRHDGAT